MKFNDKSRIGSWRPVIAALLAIQFVLPLPASSGRQKKKPQKSPPTLALIATTELTEDQAVIHALNRLGFGPRPGDLQRIKDQGLEKYVLAQLSPQAIPDSSAARLSRFPTLAMTPTELMREFPQPRVPPAQQMDREEFRRRVADFLGLAPRTGPGAPRPGPAGRPAGPPMMGQGMNLLDSKAPGRVTAELALAKLTRAIHSERQLQEVMVDFWFNHFNVFAGKGVDRWLVTGYEHDAIRPHALGRFRDLLQATAESPAMLFYLDNWMSVDPKAGDRMEAMRRRMPGAAPPRPRGLNENYARELLELHTLGVDGGYTQQDVIQVARAFTGWTIRQPRQRPEFFFDARIHDNDPKTVLGQRINHGGKLDGEAVLDLLARHPSTARFVSTKLARRFVSDEPPPVLVDRMAAAFRETDGDIAAVLKAMVYSPEFWSRSAHRAKIKKPFELVASSVRALGGEIDAETPPLPLMQTTQRLGEQLYGCQTPNGYPDTAETWVNTGALLNRMNFAMALASGRMRGTNISVDGVASLDDAAARYLASPLSAETRASIEKQLSAAMEPWTPALLAGYVLGSPEFQRK